MDDNPQKTETEPGVNTSRILVGGKKTTSRRQGVPSETVFSHHLLLNPYPLHQRRDLGTQEILFREVSSSTRVMWSASTMVLKYVQGPTWLDEINSVYTQLYRQLLKINQIKSLLNSWGMKDPGYLCLYLFDDADETSLNIWPSIRLLLFLRNSLKTYFWMEFLVLKY